MAKIQAHFPYYNFKPYRKEGYLWIHINLLSATQMQKFCTANCYHKQYEMFTLTYECNLTKFTFTHQPYGYTSKDNMNVVIDIIDIIHLLRRI